MTYKGSGLGADSKVEYNPNATGSDIVNADGTKGRPVEIGLGHELAHAESAANGTMDMSKDATVTDPDTKSQGRLTRDEISVRRTDSAIRKEQGVVERAQPN